MTKSLHCSTNRHGCLLVSVNRTDKMSSCTHYVLHTQREGNFTSHILCQFLNRFQYSAMSANMCRYHWRHCYSISLKSFFSLVKTLNSSWSKIKAVQFTKLIYIDLVSWGLLWPTVSSWKWRFEDLTGCVSSVLSSPKPTTQKLRNAVPSVLSFPLPKLCVGHDPDTLQWRFQTELESKWRSAANKCRDLCKWDCEGPETSEAPEAFIRERP